MAPAEARSATKRRLRESFAAMRPAPAVFADDEDLKPFETDGFIVRRATPLLAVLPDTEAQAGEVVRLCRAAGTPVVTRGAGTSVSGGSIPHEDGVLLVVSKLRRIVSIDPLARLAVVEPGVRNLEVSEAAAPSGLFYAPDPASQLVCSIGGNVAENSGGVHCLKYGFTTHNVAAVRGFDGEGEPIEIGGASLDSAGYDLLALVNGSEGNLVVITRVTLRLLPVPEATETLLAVFPSVRAAAAAVGEIIGEGIVPAALEMMDGVVIEACERFMGLGFPKGAEALLLAEVDGSRAEVDDTFARTRAILERHGSTEVRAARDEAERAGLWKARKGAFTALATIHPDYYTIDGTIPRRCLPDVLDRVIEWSREYGLVVGNVFHAGDGNIHPCIFYDSSVPGDLEKSEAFGARILELCIEVGGTITGEHGVGVEKLRQMCQQFRLPEIAAFHDVKRAFDPGGILNPGKAVPTVNRCAEWGGMHVRDGRVPRAEIPRF
jgi:glycolate oxidase